MFFKFDREYSLQIHNTKITVVEWGDQNAEPIICLHGWLDNAATFHYLAPLLADKYRLIGIEFPGHGQSEHLPPQADYQFISGISVIDGVLDVLHLKKAHILAHSMGAALATIYAGVMPQRIKSLIAIDALGPFISTPKETVEQLAQAIEQRKAKRGKKRFFTTLKAAAEARASVSELSPEILMPMIERGVDLCQEGYRWSSDSRLKHASWLRMTEPQLEALMNNICCPVLFIRAVDGILNDLIAIERRVSFLQNVQQLDMQGGHHLHMQYPDEIAKVSRQFLEQFD